MSAVVHQSFAHIAIGVADIKPVRALWVNELGLEVVADRPGSDPALESLWRLQPGQVAEQLLLRTPDAATGWLHFIRFNDPEAPVRAGAAAHDLCPKNIDVNCRDLPAKFEALQAAGLQFRSPVSEYEIGGATVLEVQAPIHDDINLVLIEVLGLDVELSPRGFGGVTSFVIAVPDVAREQRFYEALLGLDLLLDHRVSGPAIERVVGLPPGSALLLRLLGSEDTVFGRVELIEYEGMTGADRFPRARPPARGSLLGRFEVANLDAVLRRLTDAGIDVDYRGDMQLIFGRCRLASLRTPAGFALEVFEL